MKVLSEMYSDDMTRRARVAKDDQGYLVELWENSKFVEKRPLYDHSIQYAEDAAENWVRFIF